MNGRDDFDTTRSLIEVSSLGTAGARELRERTADDVVDAIRRRARSLDHGLDASDDPNPNPDEIGGTSSTQAGTPSLL